MKKTVLILLTFMSLATYGQVALTATMKTSNEKDRFTCQHLELLPDTKKIVLRENVKIETENLFLTADSVVFDSETQTLVAYGRKQFSFNGGEAIVNNKGKNTLRYKLKDKTIYLE